MEIPKHFIAWLNEQSKNEREPADSFDMISLYNKRYNTWLRENQAFSSPTLSEQVTAQEVAILAVVKAVQESYEKA